MSTIFPMPSRERPLAISILAALVAAAGLLDVIMGLVVIFGIRAISIPGFLTIAIPSAHASYRELRSLTIGILTLVAAVGLRYLRLWAWGYTRILMWAAILFALADFVLLSASIEYTMLAIAIAAVLLVYLSRPDVRQAFGHRE
jgi:hypothetical protein